MDVDVSIGVALYRKKKSAFKSLGKLHVLRLSEVAVANTSAAAKLISPKTGFIHIEIGDGLLDLSLHRKKKNSIELLFGFGFTFSMTDELAGRLSRLRHQGVEYQSAPFEVMFLTKSVEYIHALRAGCEREFMQGKHYLDLCRMAESIDWGFAERYLDSLRVKWMGMPLPRLFQRKINPYYVININELKRLFQNG
jgi:hypothetical protein